MRNRLIADPPHYSFERLLIPAELAELAQDFA